ncbi:organic solvent tolerance protein [Leptolyngbya sp. Heron Island J]|uniref:DUF3769 domain-containing protein n=1 Tax=Leptolyngbya sp. Heron Island J TaxID=1385935 RepID=UPI0003B98317|nr:DUF3769 domain-containing protein [Leptolyngbya sp. Heron Island J]ESA37803.1 organic solvent tolerance protein [Leptolyngbya sp. Heron Island J]
MAPIDLPPEPLLNQLSTVSISTVAPKLKPDSGAQHLLTSHSPSLGRVTHSIIPAFSSPRSLLPAEQLSEPASDDFSTPNLTQLPTLPPEVESGPELPSIDHETLDAVDGVLDTDIIQNLEPAEIEDAIEPSLAPSDIDTEAVDLENVEQLNLEESDLDTIDFDEQAPNDFEIDADTTDAEAEAQEDPAVAPEESEPPSPSAETSEPADGMPAIEATEASEPLDLSKLEITADTQIFNSERQVVIARGNAVFQLNNALLLADELWVNLVNRYVLAEGNVILTRGEQEVRGERAEYSLLQEAGTIFETRGELFLPDLEDDFASPTEGIVTSQTVFDPLNPDREVTDVTRAGGFELSSRLEGPTSGSLPQSEGGIRRLRFEAARVTFDAETWVAEDVRLTNDPFSPPELEFRTDRMTLVTLSPTADLLTTERPRLVFDQGLSLPILKSRYVLNRGAAESNQINPFLVNIGSDSQDRGGVFLESQFSVIENESTNLTITPQYFLERASNQGFTDPEVFGFELDFNTRLSSRSQLSARTTLTGLDFDQLEDNLRGNIRNRYLIGNHRLTTEYSYRDRFFNGTLGFQNVRSSIGSVIESPTINLDGRGLLLTYQAGGQLITARTDRTDLLGRPRRGGDEDLLTLGRMQASARLRKSFSLWRGAPLPATQNEGLRYSPVPLVPFLRLSASLLGVGSYYTSGDFQEEISGDIRIDGQVGHLSKDFFDYTRFNLGYSQDILSSDSSPFLFDRNVDRRVVSFGILQQIFGPILLGFQTSININTAEEINTDIIFQYSRRTYGLVLRYSPTRETGSVGFRLSDFNWVGTGSPFDERNIRRVESGVVEQR